MHLIKLPYAFFPQGKGCEQAPDRIIAALPAVNESGSAAAAQVDGISGDGDAATMDQRIFHKAKSAFQNNTFTLFLGGDHGVTYAAAKAFAQSFPDPGIIVFDAHPDCSPAYKTSHDDLLIALLKERIIRPDNILLVGLRSWAREELLFLREHRIKQYPMREIAADGTAEICDAVMSAAKSFGALYLSVDMDVLDPAFAPGVAAPEAGGLSGRELLYFVQRLRLLKNLRAADLCEVNPAKDNEGMTVKLAAKIAAEFG